MRHLISKAALVVFVVAGIALMAAAQAPPAQKPSFEVASVKPNRSGIFTGTTIGARGDLFDGTNVTLRMLLQFAYPNPMNYQMFGGPNWMDGPDRFDVRAKLVDDARRIPFEQIQLMVQSLLEDRFQLKTHRETRELPVYNLVIAKNGLKMKASEDQSPPDLTGKPTLIFDPSTPLSRGAVKVIRGLSPTYFTKLTFSASAVPITTLVSRIESNLGRRVNDKTNLTGLFDFRLEFVSSGSGGVPSPGLQATPQLPPDPGGPPIFAALEEQLGLKLESAKAPLEVLVIDSVQKPSEN